MKQHLSFAVFALIVVPFVVPAGALSVMAISEQQPPQKKPKVDESSDTVDLVPDEKSKNLAPWEDRWKNKRIGFHLADVNDVLKDHIEKLLPKKDEEELEKVCTNRRVFVPLCGKTVDMPFLVPMADEVVGVEGIRQALEEFAEEQADLKVESKGIEGGFERFKGEKITLLRGDYFALDDSKTGGKFGVIYDRASIVAIDPELREKYVKIIGKLIAPGGRMLLVVLERRGEEEAMKMGPPHSIPEATARELFEGQEWVKSMTLLQETDQLELKPEDRKRYEGLDKLLEVAYLIQAK